MPLTHRGERPLTLLLAILCGILLVGLAMTTAQLSERRCPFVRPYSRDFLNSLAKAQESLPSDSPLVLTLEDYALMRDQARMCQHLPSGHARQFVKH